MPTLAKPPATETDAGDRIGPVAFPPQVTAIRLSDDADLLRFEPNLDDVWPRSTRAGERVNDWDRFHALAAEQIETNLRNMRSTADDFEIGRLGTRSRSHLRRTATFYALHYAMMQANTQGPGQQEYYAWKARHYGTQADAEFRAVSVRLDYDLNNDGSIDAEEEQRPQVERFVRGG